jgi:hypothetical protein
MLTFHRLIFSVRAVEVLSVNPLTRNFGLGFRSLLSILRSRITEEIATCSSAN